MRKPTKMSDELKTESPAPADDTRLMELQLQLENTIDQSEMRQDRWIEELNKNQALELTIRRLKRQVESMTRQSIPQTSIPGEALRNITPSPEDN